MQQVTCITLRTPHNENYTRKEASFPEFLRFRLSESDGRAECGERTLDARREARSGPGAVPVPLLQLEWEICINWKTQVQMCEYKACAILLKAELSVRSPIPHVLVSAFFQDRKGDRPEGWVQYETSKLIENILLYKKNEIEVMRAGAGGAL